MRRIVALAALCLAGCSSLLAPQPDPSRFYLLAPLTGAAPTPPSNAFSLGIGPLSLPDYAQRQQIMIRTSPTEVTYSRVDYWGEPLAFGVSRVLGENLGQLTGTERVFSFPAPGIERVDYQVLVTFLSFEQDAQRQGLLVARWEIRTPATGNVLATRITSVTRPATGTDTDAGVAALSAALGDLSRDIAGELAGLRGH